MSADQRTSDAELLDWLDRHPQCQLSYDGWDTERWQVHEVVGGRNDREWKEIGSGETVREAIQAARKAMAHG